MMAAEILKAGQTLTLLLEGLAEVKASDDRTLLGVKSDSREITAGDLFLACRGFHSDGAAYIDDAISAGACAVVTETDVSVSNRKYTVPVIKVSDLNKYIGLIADRFYGSPSQSLRVTGVTGTNGKTSVAYIIARALSAASDAETGLIGTLGIGTPDALTAGKNTTPDALSVHQSLAAMRDSGLANVIMEVSSHALSQARVARVKFAIAIFTNLSPEHLDYHGDMQNYAEAKRQLFLTDSLGVAIINIDDAYGQKLLAELRGTVPTVSYSIRHPSADNSAHHHVYGQVIDARLGALRLDVDTPWGKGILSSKLTGEFNASNLLACLSALCLSGIDFDAALVQLAAIEAVPGRMECVSKAGKPQVIVDYAHTPDALDKALSSLRGIASGKLICVFGCGGDRDRGKRPLMGGIAEKYADEIILTNDNPRYEKPDTIIEQILAGMSRRDLVNIIPNRGEAIARAIAMARVKDVILIAGKGHETWQEIAGVRTPFSDRQLVRNLMERIE